MENPHINEIHDTNFPNFMACTFCRNSGILVINDEKTQNDFGMVHFLVVCAYCIYTRQNDLNSIFETNNYHIKPYYQLNRLN